MQLATYSGWRINGILGGLIAGLLFVLPGAFLITLLAVIYDILWWHTTHKLIIFRS